MNFHGREEEQRRIAKMLARPNQQVGLVYGRRRVGKSALIKQCLLHTDIPSVFYECKQTAEQNNVASLAALISETYHYPPIAYSSIEEVLGFFFQQALQEPLILVLDEYPYLRKTIQGMDSILQSLIDTYAESSQLKLILCGSYIDVMRSLLERDNPLFGRVDLTIDLAPMDYFDSALFYPSFSDEDKVRLFSVFGGIPYYNRLIDESLSVRENILELIAAPGARLENEVDMYLRSEISKLENANEAFEALARGFSKFSDILAQSHVSSGPSLSHVLEKLSRMGLVVKQAPINDAHNKKKAHYRICDQLSLFYFRYVFRYASQRNVMEPELFYDRYIEEDFRERFVPFAFEEVCRQFLVRQNRRGVLEQPFERIGRYYYDDPQTRTNGEFDIVTEDPLGYVFYEAKFKSAPVTERMIQEEIEQVDRTGLACYRYGFFSRSGFDAEPSERVRLIELAELYR